METGLDKGAVIAQQIVPLLPEDTLKTSYDALDAVAQAQFRQVFQYYPFWPQMKKRPLGKGSYHSLKDGEGIRRLIDSYDMPVKEFQRRVEQSR